MSDEIEAVPETQTILQLRHELALERSTSSFLRAKLDATHTHRCFHCNETVTEETAKNQNPEERATTALEKIAEALRPVDDGSGRSTVTVWDLLNGIEDSLRELRGGLIVINSGDR